MNSRKLAGLPCELRGFTYYDGYIFVFDECGTISEWAIDTDSFKTVANLASLGTTYEMAVDDHSYAILGEGRSKIHIVDRNDLSIESSFGHVGRSHALSIALWNDLVAVNTFHDSDLVYIYTKDGALVRSIIFNENYQENMAPRIASFTKLFASKGHLYLFDLFDFRLYSIATDYTIEQYQKEPHPLFLAYESPIKSPSEDPHDTMYTGTYFALSIGVVDDVFVALITARKDSSGLELVYNHIAEHDWRSSIDLTGSEASNSTRLCLEGNQFFVLDRKKYEIYYSDFPLDQ